jgi:exodeoxyribonuclease VII large subunit
VKNRALALLSDNYTKLQMLVNRRCFQKPEQLFVPFQLRLDKSALEFEANFKALFKSFEMRLENAKTKLEAFSYENTLERGFSVTYKDNKILTTTKGLSLGDRLNLKLSKGQIDCVVEKIVEE